MLIFLSFTILNTVVMLLSFLYLSLSFICMIVYQYLHFPKHSYNHFYSKMYIIAIRIFIQNLPNLNLFSYVIIQSMLIGGQSIC